MKEEIQAIRNEYNNLPEAEKERVSYTDYLEQQLFQARMGRQKFCHDILQIQEIVN